ncbi:transmembrane protein 6/97 [Gloeopeniophorella convolvens]|nr:transmembrane protein 6/97 [Gloeopeniophorella convolvens]
MGKPHRRPLSSRPADLIYFIFFLVHIPATLLVDCQALYPPHLVPAAVQGLPPWYVALSGDPLIGGAMGLLPNARELAWFRSFLYLEIFFQLPVFILGARGLWKDSRGIYALLLFYGASTATTTLACLAAVVSTPAASAATRAAGIVSVTFEQRAMLLSSYVPFFLVPLWMAVDMALRLQGLVAAGARAQQVLTGKRE